MAYDRKSDGLRSDGSKGHVLIADDAPFIIKQLSKILTDDGYKVIGTANNGEELFKLYKENSPDIDLVTLDLTMPKQDGVSTLEKIMEFDKDAHVVVVTANNNPSLMKKILDIGAKNFIIKPFKPENVLSVLSAATRK